jgi:DNA repair exonuclease SbcCD ATPase subunit
VNDRESYRQGASDRDRYEQARLAAAAEWDQLQGEFEGRQAYQGQADEAVRAAEAAETTARTRLTDAHSRRDRFAALAGEERCSLCGQRIDERHAVMEREQLAEAVGEAERELDRCERDTHDARRRRGAAAGHTQDVENRLAAAAEQIRVASSTRDEANRRANEAATRFQWIAARLPEPYRGQVTRIETDGYPRAADVVDVQNLAETYQTCAARVELLRQEQQTRAGLITQLNAKQQALEQLGPQPAPAVLESERERLDADLLRLSGDQRRAADDRRAAEAEARRLAAEAKAAGQEVTRLTREQAAAEFARAAEESQADAERRRLPAPWADTAEALTDAERTRLGRELLGLEQSGVEAEAEALANDRAVRTSRVQQLHEAEEQIARLPEDAQCPAEQVQVQLRMAENEEGEASGVLTEARSRLEKLTSQDADHKQVTAELDKTGKESDLHSRLAGLLGKKGLQLAIVRNAEREIVELANETLSRVSNGELRLDPPAPPEDDDGEAAFDLSVRQAGDPHPISLAFLSGSQRFRVAVALALAVGRFASRQARPLEAVIIDEGFGCLDRVGRAGMIEELQRLQRPGDLPTPLKRIILVSHQEDFADSFPVGYRLAKENGPTTARRFG